jgi:hypothetical protein
MATMSDRGVQGGERDGILDRVIVEYDATRPAGGYLSGRRCIPIKPPVVDLPLGGLDLVNS